jgi:hypothetical protein
MTYGWPQSALCSDPVPEAGYRIDFGCLPLLFGRAAKCHNKQTESSKPPDPLPVTVAVLCWVLLVHAACEYRLRTDLLTFLAF